MNIFDVVGPVMVGPSSSHTAGAVKIGYISRKLLGEQPVSARILLYGSFLTTGKGHGTRKALVAGLLGMQPDDARIPQALMLAEEQGMHIEFGEAQLKEAHPNTAQLFCRDRMAEAWRSSGSRWVAPGSTLPRSMESRRISPVIIRRLSYTIRISRDTWRR